MFKLSYINAQNIVCHRGQLNSIEEIIEWVESQKDKIRPLKIFIWDENSRCYKFYKFFDEIKKGDK